MKRKRSKASYQKAGKLGGLAKGENYRKKHELRMKKSKAGKMGAHKLAESMTAEERSERARKAALDRWKRKKEEHP